MTYQLITYITRCDARPDNLDDVNAHLRTHEKTDSLLELFDSGTVWDEYGLRSDVVVCHFNLGWQYTFILTAIVSLLLMIFPAPTFTN